MTDIPAAPPPEPEDCLVRSRTRSSKGGTLIAEDVHDLVTHRRRVVDPGGYRPGRCPRCSGQKLHLHDYRQRTLHRGMRTQVVTVVRYICADPECGATWQILPAFVARHLWRCWRTVECTVGTDSAFSPSTEPIPKRTRQRWSARLASAARPLVVLLATSGGALLEAVANTVGFGATRRTLVEAYAVTIKPPSGRRLADVAMLIHRLERGIRLM